MGNGFVQYPGGVRADPSRRASGWQHQLADGHGPASCRRRRGGRSRDAERRALHHRWLRLPEPPRQRRAVRRRRHPRQAAPARPGDGAGGRVQPPGHALPAVARLRRSCRRARPRPGGVPAPRLRHGQSDRADFAPLARRDAHHLRRRDQRPHRRSLASRRIGVQRPGARRRAARLRLRPAGLVLRAPAACAHRRTGAASVGRAPRERRGGRRRLAAARRRAHHRLDAVPRDPRRTCRWQRRSPGAATTRCRRGRTPCWPKGC